MIDDFAIILSTVVCVFVIFRAVRMDRTIPWFERPSKAIAGAPVTPARPEPGLTDPHFDPDFSTLWDDGRP